VLFEALPPPTQDEVERLLRVVHLRMLRLLEKRGALPAQGPEDALRAYQAHSLQQRLRWTELDVWPPPRKQPRCALLEGFSLHANTHLHANDRQGLERLCLLRGARRAGAGAFVTSGGRPHRLADEAPAARRHHAPALHRAGILTTCGVLGASASGKPHEVSWRLRSRRESAAISAAPSRSGGEEREAPPGRSRGGERGAGGRGEAGAEEGEDAARRLSRGCCAGHSRWMCSPASVVEAGGGCWRT
jgi:hypothetical protein